MNEEDRFIQEDAQEDPEKEHRYSLRRLEMFWKVYKRKYDAKEIAPVGSDWLHDSQYSYTMFLVTSHNSDVQM